MKLEAPALLFGFAVLSLCQSVMILLARVCKINSQYVRIVRILASTSYESSIYYTTSGMYAKYCSMHTIF